MTMAKRFWATLVMALMFFGLAGAQAAETKAADYVLGPGDVIRISVFQSPDLSMESRISDSGTITYPLLGQVKLGGLSVRQAEQRIADGLKSGNFVKQPQVTVQVATIRSAQVSVLGQVARPGKYPLDLASVKLTDVLAQAGGVVPGGSDTVIVTGTRNGKPFKTEVDLPSVLSRTTSGGSDVALENGDTIFVDRAPFFYVYGEVQRPGPVRLERDMTLLQALAGAGGLTPRGTDRGIRIHRKGPDGKTQEISPPSMEERMREGDVVKVKESLF